MAFTCSVMDETASSLFVDNLNTHLDKKLTNKGKLPEVCTLQQSAGLLLARFCGLFCTARREPRIARQLLRRMSSGRRQCVLMEWQHVEGIAYIKKIVASQLVHWYHFPYRCAWARWHTPTMRMRGVRPRPLLMPPPPPASQTWQRCSAMRASGYEQQSLLTIPTASHTAICFPCRRETGRPHCYKAGDGAAWLKEAVLPSGPLSAGLTS